MRLLLIGPPGSGKGTQAERIAAHFGITHISSGELLRQHVAEGTTIGRTVDDAMAKGDLVPDGIVMDVLRKPVEAATRSGGYVLDGFPRTVAQAEAAYLIARGLGASVQVALYLKVPREELIRRMLARAGLAGRSDDRQEVMIHRLDVFDELTTPLLEYYAGREVLVTVDGALPVAEVTQSCIDELEKVRPQLT
ncbi:MAG TPA: adenylate kinase [Micromonosporaceae bacterium]